MRFNYFVCLMCCVLFFSCASTKKITVQQSDDYPPDAAAEKIVIAEIGEKKLYLSDFQKMLRFNNFQTSQTGFFEKENSDELTKAFNSFVMINTIIQLAKEDKLDKSDTFIETVEDFKQQLLVEFFDKKIYESIRQPSDLDLYEYYQKNKLLFAEPAKIALKNALADFDDLPAIKTVYEKLRAGEKLEDIVKDNNLSSKVRISDLGFIEEGIIEPELEKYAFELNVNHFTDIIKSKFGYHILYCYQIIEPVIPEFTNDLKEEIYHKVIQEKYTDALEKIVAHFKKNNKYIISQENLKYMESSSDEQK